MKFYGLQTSELNVLEIVCKFKVRKRTFTFCAQLLYYTIGFHSLSWRNSELHFKRQKVKIFIQLFFSEILLIFRSSFQSYKIVTVLKEWISISIILFRMVCYQVVQYRYVLTAIFLNQPDSQRRIQMWFSKKRFKHKMQ